MSAGNCAVAVCSEQNTGIREKENTMLTLNKIIMIVIITHHMRRMNLLGRRLLILISTVGRCVIR